MKKLFHFVIVIFIFSCIILLIMETILMPAYVRFGQTRYLIDLKDLPLEIALSRLHSEGFKGIVEDTVLTNLVTPNNIIDQFPLPDSRVKPGRTIRLKIAQPEKMVPVPNLLGQSQRSAEIMLHQLGLAIDTIYTEYNPVYPKGTVAWQSPKGNDLLKRGWGVHLTISKGMPPNFFQVPNLFGLSQEKAEFELEQAGLKLGKVSYEQNEDLIPFTVLDQSIKESTVLESPKKIDVTVSVLDINDIFNQMMNK